VDAAHHNRDAIGRYGSGRVDGHDISNPLQFDCN
jgi:hypothetical protein